MPNLPIPEPDDTGEEVVSMRDGSGSSLPDMPEKDPVLYLWRGKYQMRMDGDTPVIVPKLIPHVMRPGIGGMGERKGDLAITEDVIWLGARVSVAVGEEVATRSLRR
jgi:hypothetical protein